MVQQTLILQLGFALDAFLFDWWARHLRLTTIMVYRRQLVTRCTRVLRRQTKVTVGKVRRAARKAGCLGLNFKRFCSMYCVLQVVELLFLK